MTAKPTIQEVLDGLVGNVESLGYEHQLDSELIDALLKKYSVEALSVITAIIKEAIGEDEEVVLAGGIPIGKELDRNSLRKEIRANLKERGIEI